MTKLSELKAATSLVELAFVLGIPASAIAYTLYIAPGPKYTTFDIPKRAGGARKISAPNERLKDLQEKLADLLVECRREIEAAEPKRKIVSHGFRKECSIITNARQHRCRRYVLNLDIEGFFPAFNFGRVRGFFIKNQNFALHEKVATVIAQIACYENALPQGSPCSPIISDLITLVLDMRMIGLMKKHKCTYSRYADDLTISTNLKEFPTKLAYPFEQGSSLWVLGDDLLEALHRAWFSVNHKKTRMQYRDSRQLVTGLSVNKKINIRSDYYRRTRSMCYSLFMSGSYIKPGKPGSPIGTPAVGNISALEGILNHIYFVKQQENARTGAERDFRDRHGIERLYGRFMFYKSFVALEKPIILAEGKTDSIYLRGAIKRLNAYHAVLRTIKAGTAVNNISFLKHSHLTREMLGLDSSSSYFPNFVHNYGELVSKFKHAPLQHPVIILIDNDDGAKGVFGVLNNKKINITHKTNAPFYAVTRNLYVVKTPEAATSSAYSQIEDLFDGATRSVELNGKKFNKKNDTNTATEYGKAYFADYVVAPNINTIDFSGFTPLLDRILAVIAYHKQVVAAGAQ